MTTNPTNRPDQPISDLYEETKRKLDEVTILYEMTKIATSSLGVDQLLSETVGSLGNFFQANALYLALVDEKGKKFSFHSFDREREKREFEEFLEDALPKEVARRGEAIRVNNLRELERGDSDEAFSEMCVPLRAGSRLFGLLDVRRERSNPFSEGELDLLKRTSDHLAKLIEKVSSEERYRAVVEGVLEGVMVINGDRCLTYCNEKLSEMLGFSKDELIGIKFDRLVEKEIDLGRAQSASSGGDGTEDSSLPEEVRVRRKDGKIRVLEIRSTRLDDLAGQGNRIAFVKDVTEKKKMEEQLLQAEKLRALGEMASGVAHDFNNALTIILGNIQLLLFSAKSEEEKETLRTMEKVAKDSARTVKRLQEFARNKAQHQLFRLDINAIVKDAIEITKPKWKDDALARGISFEVVANLREVPCSAGNVSELLEVITNMIFNAIEAMPQGGRIELGTFEKEGEVFIQIKDNGMGMTEEVRQRVFEPFFTTKPFTNSGLGLSMSYGIIRRFGGDITVESELGRGTIFTISLPVRSGIEKERTSYVSFEEGKGIRILVIDDEELVRDVLLQTLSRANYEVTLASSGEEGLRLFCERPFDIVLTDLAMPTLSGWEVCRRIKETSPHTQVAMITGWGLELDPQQIIESGVDRVISKPFDFGRILNLIAEMRKAAQKNASTGAETSPQEASPIVSGIEM